MNIFEKASRLKLRFPSTVGNLTVEQLWDLPLTARSTANPDLDSVAKAVNADLKGVTEESFVSSSDNPKKAAYELQLEIVKHIIAEKIAARENEKQRADRAARKAEILAVLETKQQEELKGKSVEDLQKELAALSD